MAREGQSENLAPAHPRSVLITGASSGIGRACAARMGREGWQVFATVRKESDAKALMNEGTPGLQTILLDVTDGEQVAEAAKAVGQHVGSGGLHGLVNNAGIAVGGLLEYVDTAELRRVLETNTIAPLTVTKAFIPLLRRARGRIVMMSSMAGFSSTPLVSPYCASKFALEALTDGLRLELWPWGIDVVSVQPGAINTVIWDKARSYVEEKLQNYPADAFDKYGPLLASVSERLAEQQGVDAEQVARTVSRALTTARPRNRYLVGRDAQLRRWIERLPTSLRDRIVLSRMPKYGKKQT